MRIAFTILLIAGLFASCRKSNSNANIDDKTAPVITVISPGNGQIFNAGATISVSATVTDNNKVSQTEIHLINETTGELLRDIHNYPDAPSAIMQDSFTAVAGSVYTIKFIARDPSQNETRIQLSITVN